MDKAFQLFLHNMEATRTPMKESELAVLKSLREQGYVVAVFSPEDLTEVDPKLLEEKLLITGWEYIDENLREPVDVSNREAVLERDQSCRITVETLSVHVRSGEDGVSVSIYPLGKNKEAVGETWATYGEDEELMYEEA